MTMWQREFIHGRRFKGQEGQSLVETALTLPLLLGIGFNIINWGYLCLMVRALSAAPGRGVQSARKGGAAGRGTPPPPAPVRDLVWENVTHAVHGSLSPRPDRDPSRLGGLSPCLPPHL